MLCLIVWVVMITVDCITVTESEQTDLSCSALSSVIMKKLAPWTDGVSLKFTVFSFEVLFFRFCKKNSINMTFIFK